MNFEDIFSGKITHSNLVEYSPLVLAFIGDAVHTLFVRDGVVKGQNLDANHCHRYSSKQCNAKAQAQRLDNLISTLTEKELDIVRRARNAKAHHTAKNSDIETYKKATSFEALVGYLYLTGDFERLNQILKN